MNKNLVILAIFLVAIAVSCITLYKNWNDDEMNVYVSLVTWLDSSISTDQAVFEASLSACGVEEYPSKPDEVTQNLVVVNASSKDTRNINKLSSIANVVLDNHQSHRWSTLNIVKLSRVGFNEEKSLAAVCMESSTGGTIVYFKKTGFRSWTQVSTKYTWAT